MHNHLVVALAYDRLCTFEFGCVVELFALERPGSTGIASRSARASRLRAAGGITVAAPYRLATLDRADTIVIPGWRDPDEPPPEPLLKKLRAAHRRGARLCSICSGVFVLAAAGVLDGLTVTTHWRYAEKLQARYPALRVNPDALYVDEGQVITSAGSAAGRHAAASRAPRSRRRDREPGRAASCCRRIATAGRRSSCRARSRRAAPTGSRS